MKRILFVVVLLASCLWMSNCGTGSNSTSTVGIGGTGNGGGTSSTAALAYVIGGGNTIGGVRVDTANVATVTAGSPLTIPAQAQGIAVRNNLLFVSGFTFSGAPTAITGFRPDASGALTQISSTPINGSSLLASDNAGGFLYASSSFVPVFGRNNTVAGIFGYAVDQSGGILTQITGSPFSLAEGISVADIEVSPTGTAICVNVALAPGIDNVDCYPRRPDGTIDPNIVTFSISNAVGFDDIAISGDGRFVFAVGAAQNLIYYGSTTLSSNGNAAFISSVGTFPVSVAADRTGKWLVVADQNSKDVSVYSISPSGVPTGGVTTPLIGIPTFLRFSLNGNYLFVSTSAGTEVYLFDSLTGTLTAAPGSPVPSGSGGRLAAQ